MTGDADWDAFRIEAKAMLDEAGRDSWSTEEVVELVTYALEGMRGAGKAEVDQLRARILDLEEENAAREAGARNLAVAIRCHLEACDEITATFTLQDHLLAYPEPTPPPAEPAPGVYRPDQVQPPGWPLIRDGAERST